MKQKNIDFLHIFSFFLLFIHCKTLHLLKGKKFAYIKNHLKH